MTPHGNVVHTGKNEIVASTPKNLITNIAVRYMGALSNSGRKSANLVGFYKGIQSAGAAVMWALDSGKLSLMSELASNWGILAGSLIVASPVIIGRIKDHVEIEEDLAFSDETFADVAPTSMQEGPNKVESA